MLLEGTSQFFVYGLNMRGFFIICFAFVHVHADKHEGKVNKPATPSTTECTETNDDEPITVTPSGTIRGSWMESRRGRRFQAYRGIRYAEPPVGELRFKPPVDIHHYKETVDASKEGPACPLPVPPNYYIDEDCLRINVYTPSNNVKELLPVIAFIHAGGFYAFSGRSDVVGPHSILDRDVVFVAFNYRIGSLGWLSTGDEHAPGNNGIKDQVSALRWMQRNIAAFGGDPNRVTIAGCSAGSNSVMFHMISPMSKGLFHRGISMSGSLISKGPAIRDQKDLAIKQAEFMNCPTNSSKAIIDCLKTKPWREMGDSLPKFFEFGPGDPVALWSPVVEPDFGQERFLTIDPLDAIRQGKMHSVPYWISQTKDEFYWKAFSILQNETLTKAMNEDWDRIAPLSFLLPKPTSKNITDKLREVYLKNKPLKVNDSESEKNLGRLYGDSIIGFGVHRLANLMSRHSKHDVYYSVFSYIGNDSFYEDANGKPLGAAHHDDMLYVLTLTFNFPIIPLDSPDSHVVDEMTALWYNFARTGNPNPRGDTPELGSLSWPPMKPDSRKYLEVADKLTIHKNLFEDRYEVWEHLYPILY